MTVSTKKKAGLLLAIVVVLQACSTGAEPAAETRAPVHGLWETYDSIEDLSRRAELVVVGTVGAYVGRYEIWDVDSLTGEEIFAKADDVYEFAVADVVAGELPEGSESTLLVGSVDFGTEAENTTGLASGDHLLLFLAPFAFGGTERGWVSLSADTGIFDISEGRVLARGVVGDIAGYEGDVNEVLDSVASSAASTSG